MDALALEKYFRAVGKLLRFRKVRSRLREAHTGVFEEMIKEHANGIPNGTAESACHNNLICSRLLKRSTSELYSSKVAAPELSEPPVIWAPAREASEIAAESKQKWDRCIRQTAVPNDFLSRLLSRGSFGGRFDSFGRD